MISIGVTGGIGSGKSLVCSQFAALDVPIFFADIVAKEIITSDEEVKRKILEEFGVRMGGTEAVKERKELAEIVFSRPEKLRTLNEIVHPIVFSRLNDWLQKTALSSVSPYVLVEAALIFESGLDERLDYILAVTAETPVRMARVVQRDKTTEQKVAARMANQMKPEELAEASDFIIHNNGTMEELQQKVRFFHLLFSNLKQRHEVR